jgi:outer membrane lipoprotein SlyB
MSCEGLAMHKNSKKLKGVRYGEVGIGYAGPRPATFAFAALLAGFGAVAGALRGGIVGAVIGAAVCGSIGTALGHILDVFLSAEEQ